VSALTSARFEAHVLRESLVGIASGWVRARRLGKSQGHERRAIGSMEGCPGTRMRLSKPETRRRPWLRRFQLVSRTVRLPVPLEATKALRGHERFGRGSSSRALTARRGAEGRHPQCGAPDLRGGHTSTRGTQLAASPRGGREPGGVRHTECAAIVRAEVGDGLTATPLVFFARRANGRR